MTKQEVITAISVDCQITLDKAEQVLDSFIYITSKALVAKKSVKLKGFGTFTIKRFKAREGINPRNGKPMKLPACNRVRFLTSDVLQELVRNK